MSWLKLIVIALLVLGLVVVYYTFTVLAAAFLGILFALCLTGLGEWYREKWDIPALVATLLAMVMVAVVVAGLGFVIGPPLARQADELGSELPAAMQQSLEWMNQRKWGRYVVQEAESLSGLSADQVNGTGDEDQEASGQDSALDPLRPPAVSNPGEADGNDNGEDQATDPGGSTAGEGSMMLQNLYMMLSLTASTLMLVLVCFAVTLFVALSPDIYRRGVFWLIPTKHEAVAKLTLGHISTALRWWIMGRLVSMLVVGLLTSLGMWMIGMPAPLALGALAGVLSFVPNLGPIVAAVPGLLLAAPEGPWMLLYALGVYVGAQIIESNLITPMIDQYTVTTPPAVLIVVQVIMGILAGPWGVIVATPLLVVVFVLIQQFHVRQYLQKPITVLGSSGDDASDA